MIYTVKDLLKMCFLKTHSELKGASNDLTLCPSADLSPCLNLLCLLHYCCLCITGVLQMRTSVRSGTPVLMPATTPWAPTTALVLEASLSQLTAGPVRVDDSQT